MPRLPVSRCTKTQSVVVSPQGKFINGAPGIRRRTRLRPVGNIELLRGKAEAPHRQRLSHRVARRNVG